MLQDIMLEVFTFQVEDFGWTALSIISISLAFIYSISAAGDPRTPLPVKIPPPNYLAQANQRKAEIAARIELEQRRIRIREGWSKRGFRFKRLPAELQLHVLSFSAECPKTYRALVLVSQYFCDSTLRACLPFMRITLSSTKQLSSFSSLVYRDESSRPSLPSDIGIFVHNLWVCPLRREDFIDAFHILRACTNVRVLACDARGLSLISKSQRFKHTWCRDLTLLLTRQKWDLSISTPSGLQFLQQLTHLRIMGEQCLPQSVSFDQLLYLSYTEPRTPDVKDDLEVEKPQALGNTTIFPSLEQVVLTRRSGPEEGVPVKVNSSLVLAHVRRDRTEMEIWRDGFDGESLWRRASKALPPPKKPSPMAG